MPLKTQVDDAPTVNLTPMIDIVFLVIIFFMVGTKFSEMERNIKLNVPEVADTQAALTDAPANRVVNVHRNGAVTLDRHAVTIDELTARLSADHAQYSELGVTIRGDGVSHWRHVAKAMNACRQAGVTNIGVSVKLAKQRGAVRR